MSHAPAFDSAVLASMEDSVIAFLRTFGMLEADRTPCGQPLSVSQAHTLLAVAQRPGLAQHELVSTLGLARGTVSELVTGLERRGWIRRTAARTDRRVQCLELTDEGAGIEAEVAAARHDLFTQILAAIDPAERDGIIRAIDVLAVATRDALASRQSSR